MSFVRIVLSATAAVVVSMSAQAATTQNPGTYDATSVTTNGFLHTLWLPDFNGPNVADDYWQFVDGSSVFVVDNTSATLTADIIQNTDTSNEMAVSMTFNVIDPPANPSVKCKIDPCDQSGWDFFEIAAATLTGTKGVVSGVTLVLDSVPTPGQLGVGGNDKDGFFGFSTWFMWTDAANSSLTGNGDVNMRLALNPGNTPEVPLPASALLLLAGLGGFAGLRRRG